MKCPNCSDTALVMTERQGVEIDYCPQCRGVWLDRGELDKRMERAVAQVPTASAAAPARGQPQFQDSDYDHRARAPLGRRKSWLSDIFD